MNRTHGSDQDKSLSRKPVLLEPNARFDVSSPLQFSLRRLNSACIQHSESHFPFTSSTDPSAGASDLHLYGLLPSSSTPHAIIQGNALASSLHILPLVPSASPTTLRELEDRTGVQAPPSSAIARDVHTSDNSTVDTLPPAKRKKKASVVKTFTRKRLTDLYSKRSMTLIEKSKELADMTDAFVVIYTARPESVGEGIHRLFISKNLRDADGALAKRISDDIGAVAIGAARLTGRAHARPCKKARTGDTEQQTTSSAVEGSGSTSANRVVPPPTASSSCAAAVVQPTLANGEPGLAELSLTGEITTLVRLLENNSGDVQSYALSVIKKLVQSDHGVTVVHGANAVPRLIELLDPHPEWSYDIACQSLSVLSHMANHQRPCMAMVRAGVVPPLGRLLSQPIGKDALVHVAQTLSRCSLQFPRSDFSSLFLPNLLQSLISLLSSNQTQLWVAAVEAIDNVSRVGRSQKMMKYLVDEGVVRQLCHLFSHCTDLLALEKLASAISHVAPHHRNDDDIEVLIKEDVLQPLLSLIGHRSIKDQVGACRALRLCYFYRLDYRLGNQFVQSTVIPQLIPLLSSDNDELFVEALWAVLLYTWYGPKPPDYLNFTTFRRLICLLSCNNDPIVANAAHCISEFSGKFDEWELKHGLFYEILDLGGLRRLVSFISSHNIDLAIAATGAITSLYDYEGGMKPIYRRLGVITAIVRCATSGLHSPRQLQGLSETVIDLGFDEEDAKDLIHAGLIVPLVHLLSPQDGTTDPQLVHHVGELTSFDYSYQTMLLEGGFTSLLEISLSYLLNGSVVDHTITDNQAVDSILSWINHSSIFRSAMIEYGVEDVLSAYLTAHGSGKYREEVEKVLASLFEEGDGDEDGDSD